MGRNLTWFALMSLIWGLTWAAVKIGLESVPPLLLAALRYLLTTALLVIVVRGAWAALAEGRALRTVASALLVNTGTYGFLFWGMQTVPSGLSGLVNLALIPVLLFGLAAATGQERLNWRHTLALAIGATGLVALFWTRLAQSDGGDVAGLSAIVAGTVCYCAGSVVARPLIGPVQPLALTLVHAAIGGAVLLALSVAIEPISLSTLRNVATPAVAGALLFLSLFGTVIAYTLYLILLRDWGPARAGLYAFVSPIVALATGVWLFDESLGKAEVIGAALLTIAAAVALLKPAGANARASSAGICE